MSGASTITFDQGIAVARELLTLLAGTFTRASVAGSLRRGKPTVGDVELVLAPAFDGAINLLEQRCDQLLGQHLEKRMKQVKGKLQVHAWGQPGKWSRYKAASFHGLPLDMFLVLPDRQWGPTLLIRTGPGDANKTLVANVPYGVLPAGMKFDDGGVLRDGVPLDTPEEEDVFAACALPWMPPGFRSVERYRQWSDPDWPDAYNVHHAYSKWHDRRGYMIPRDAIDREGVPMWLREQVDCAAPAAMALPVEQMGLFGAG